MAYLHLVARARSACTRGVASGQVGRTLNVRFVARAPCGVMTAMGANRPRSPWEGLGLAAVGGRMAEPVRERNGDFRAPWVKEKAFGPASAMAATDPKRPFDRRDASAAFGPRVNSLRDRFQPTGQWRKSIVVEHRM
jgi:hypothetical protein